MHIRPEEICGGLISQDSNWVLREDGRQRYHSEIGILATLCRILTRAQRNGRSLTSIFAKTMLDDIEWLGERLAEWYSSDVPF